MNIPFKPLYSLISACIIITMIILIVDAILVAGLMITENPTTKSINPTEQKNGIFEPVHVQSDHTRYGNITVWDKAPSETLTTAYNLLSPLMFLFFVPCFIGVGVKIVEKKRKEKNQ